MSRRLRVLMISDVSPCAIEGGAERVLWEHASRLVKLGHHVRVLSRSPAGDAPARLERDGVHIRHFPADRRSPLRFFWSSVVQARRAAREVMTAGIDVLHLHQPLSGLGVLSSPAARRLPSLYTFHSPAPLEYRSRRGMTRHHRAGWAGRLSEALLGVVERASLNLATRIHVLSDFSGAQIATLYGIGDERVVKIAGGVDTERFRPADRGTARRALQLPSGPPVLFTVRNLQRRMGLESLIRAMAILLRDVPEAVLLIGGAGPLRGELESLTASLDLADRVRFLGFVPETTLPLHYQAADLFVLPTRELEGFGLVAVEALACGIPVLGTPVGAIPEVLRGVEDSGLFAGTDPDAIARGLRDRLVTIRADPHGQVVQARCRAHAVTRFAWEPIMKQLERTLLGLARQ